MGNGFGSTARRSAYAESTVSRYCDLKMATGWTGLNWLDLNCDLNYDLNLNCDLNRIKHNPYTIVDVSAPLLSSLLFSPLSALRLACA